MGEPSNFSPLRLLVDVREQKLLEALQRNGGQNYPNASALMVDPPTHLTLGDVVLMKGNTEPLLVIERKTLADLLASVKDGRYHDQKARLLQSYPRECLLYVIESLSWSFHPNGLAGRGPQENKILMGCFINTLVRDRIPLVRTSDVEDTCAFLEQIVQRVRENPDTYGGAAASFADSTESSSARAYTPTAAPVPVSKKDLLTPLACFLAQLAQIPGISHGKALQIAEATGAQSMLEFVAIPDLQAQLQSIPGIGKKITQTVLVYLGITSLSNE